MNVSMKAEQIQLIRNYIKLKLIADNVTLIGYEEERAHVKNLILKAIHEKESNSAIVVGPRGCGKTTLINSIIAELEETIDLQEIHLVKLNGLLHQEDKVSIQAITAQLKLENAVANKTFNTFAENINFLINCLKDEGSCKTIICILEEFDLFCHGGFGQNLLYSLFDITNSREAPICVIGVSCCDDVIELLEKRVKSRFSQRLINLFRFNKEPPLQVFLKEFIRLLSLPKDISSSRSKKDSKVKRKKDYNIHKDKETQAKNKSKKAKEALTEEEIIEELESDYETEKRVKSNASIDVYSLRNSFEDSDFLLPSKVAKRYNVDLVKYKILDNATIDRWNTSIMDLVKSEKVLNSLELFCYYWTSEHNFKTLLVEVVSQLTPERARLEGGQVCDVIERSLTSTLLLQIQSLSVLEISLLIAMKHYHDIFSGQPMNFEIIYDRYKKFTDANSSVQRVPRAVVLKAFESLEALEIIRPVRGLGSVDRSKSDRIHREYRMYSLAVSVPLIEQAVKGYGHLPTELQQWAGSYIV